MRICSPTSRRSGVGDQFTLPVAQPPKIPVVLSHQAYLSEDQKVAKPHVACSASRITDYGW